MKYFLDTNICVYLKRHQPPEIVERFKRLERGDVAISSVTLGELEYGIQRSPHHFGGVTRAVASPAVYG